MRILPTIRETVVGQVEKSDLDNEVMCQFFGIPGPDDDPPDFDWIRNYNYRESYWKDNEHIPIEMLQAAVDELKTKGATHVQIYPHGDHQSYYFTGVKLELVPTEEIVERQKQELKHAIIRNQNKLHDDEKEIEERKARLQAQKEELNDLEL